jgi:hypothetical protein
MRSYQVFAAMSRERATAVMKNLAEKAPGAYAQTLQLAALAMKARPVYLQRQPADRRADAIRRALSRVSSDPIAGETLAVYFLECRKELLVEWLDTVGLEHDEGSLAQETPEPPSEKKLREATESFLAVDGDPDRRLVLLAFAAQDAIEWPVLDALLAPT